MTAEPTAAPQIAPACASDANYHRLRYQLAAQLMHAAIESDDARGFAEGALAETERSIAIARVVRDRLADRAAEPRWRRLLVRGVELSTAERRLHRFLVATILPCNELVAAGAHLRLDALEVADEHAARARLDAADRSYRALYNGACFHAERAAVVGGSADALRAEGLTRALYYLRRALLTARGERRRELARWARTDPSLRALRDDPDVGAHAGRLLDALDVGGQAAGDAELGTPA